MGALLLDREHRRELPELVERSLLATFVLAQWLIGYNVVNFATWGRSLFYRLDTWIDLAVPMVSEWIYVYSLAYPCCYVPVLVLPLARLRVACIAYTGVIVTSLIAFLAMPVYIERPEPLAGATGAWLLQLTRLIDQPFNCFPSLHVSLDFLAAFFCLDHRPALGRALLAGSILISVSTLFVKQHYVLDLAAGVPLAMLAYRLANKEAVRRWVGDL
jgi:membrane-associated phospholipid phosphatase